VQPNTLATLVDQRIVDPGLAALTWLLVEGGVPILVVGQAALERRVSLAGAMLAVDPRRPWLVLDADVEPPTVTRLSPLVGGGPRLGVVSSARDLQDAMDRFSALPGSLPQDAVRRLGVVIVAADTERGLRLQVVHYLRPTERDGQGHIQRRPPAVLSAWDESTDSYEDFAWGIMPELADRVDRSPAEMEERRSRRAAFLVASARAGHTSMDGWASAVTRHLAGEPPRSAAPHAPGAPPAPSHGGPEGGHPH
jgi:hypothetical protein